jgi:cold shock CspA family protein
VGGPVAAAVRYHGRVAAFDPARGLGTVAEDGGAAYGFHATAIADGSRRIAVGAQVTFTVAPGHGGLYEARSLVSVDVPAGSHQRPA